METDHELVPSTLRLIPTENEKRLRSIVNMGRKAFIVAPNDSGVQVGVGYHYKTLGNLFSVLSYEKAHIQNVMFRKSLAIL